jgi:hypothetical protein
MRRKILIMIVSHLKGRRTSKSMMRRSLRGRGMTIEGSGY